MNAGHLPSSREIIEQWLTEQNVEAGFTPTEMHGALCALACGPEPSPQWHEQLLETTAPPEVPDALESFRRRLAEQLAGGESLTLPCSLDPYREDDGRDLASWCAGFMAGVLLNEEQWFGGPEQEGEEQQDEPREQQLEEEQEMAHRLLPFLLISGVDQDPELDQLWEDSAVVRRMALALPELLEELYLHFHAPEIPDS